MAKVIMLKKLQNSGIDIVLLNNSAICFGGFLYAPHPHALNTRFFVDAFWLF